MDDQAFKILLTGFSMLVSIIGFFIAWMIRAIQSKQVHHSKRLDSQLEMINDNKREIDKNSALDREIRRGIEKEFASMDKKFEKLALQMKEDYKNHRDDIRSLLTGK